MDDVDRKLLAALQANGRISNADLARLVDLAPSSTLDRVRKLEERGVIRGYRAVLDPPALGYQVQAMVLISLDRHQAGPIDEFEARVRAVPGGHDLPARDRPLRLHAAGRGARHRPPARVC